MNSYPSCIRLTALAVVYASACLTGPARAQSTVTLPLDTAVGWHLLGNGLATSIGVASAFGDAAKVESVWKWLPSANSGAGGWAFYSPTFLTPTELSTYAVTNGFSVLSSINPGEGFWVRAKAATSFSHSGIPRPFSALDLGAGWTLAASGDLIRPTDLNRAFSRASQSDPIPDNVTSLWSWSGTDQKWYFYSPALERSNTLDSYIAGSGYLNFGTRPLARSEGFWVNYPREIGFGTATGQVSAPLGSGQYSISYASSTYVGIDGRYPVTASFGARGELTGYSFSANEHPPIGLMSAAEVAGDAEISIGRWNGGRMTGYYSSIPGFTENQGFHYAIGVRDQTTVPVCGERTYRLTAFTAPTRGDGLVVPGSLDAGGTVRLAFGPVKKIVNFGSLTDTNTTLVEIKLDALVNGLAIPLSTGVSPGGLYNGFFSPGGTTNYRAFLAGVGSGRFGLSYNTGIGPSKIAGAAYFSLDAGTDTTVGCTVATHAGIESGSVSAFYAPSAFSGGNEVAVASRVHGLDDRQVSSASMTFVGARLTGFSGFSPSGNHSIGTAMIGELAGNAVATIGRWNGGTATTPITGATALALDGWDGLHYAIGKPAQMSLIGAGNVATYSLSAATKPTSVTGILEPGTLTSATMTIDTTLPDVTLQPNKRVTYSLALTGTIGGSPFSISIPAGQNTYTYVATSTIAFFGSTIRGAVVGPSAEHVVLTYSTGTGGIQGAVLLSRPQ